jgi:hypothetical protein
MGRPYTMACVAVTRRAAATSDATAQEASRQPVQDLHHLTLAD